MSHMTVSAWTYLRAPAARYDRRDDEALSAIAGVAARHGLSVEEIEGRSQRSRALAARCEAMAAVYDTGLYGMVDVGSFFDCRDHSTVSRAIRRYRAAARSRA